jgi:hypothetical protein
MMSREAFDGLLLQLSVLLLAILMEKYVGRLSCFMNHDKLIMSENM